MRSSLLLFSLSFAVFGSDWPRYRGPNGGGVSPDKQLPAEIGPDRNLVWKTSTLKGNSSPVVIGGRIFLTGYEGDERAVLCYDAASGKQLWRRATSKARSETQHPLNGPATPSVATDGRNVFAYLPEWGLLSFDLDGQERWRTPLGPFGSIQGMAVSPLYAEGNVVMLIDTPEEAFLLAFDAKTGKQVWKVDRPVGFLGSYATPSIYNPPRGPAQIIVAGANELTGYQARTGERLWWARNVITGPAALPLVAGDAVYTVEPAGDPAPPFSGMAGPFDANKDGVVEIAKEVTGNDLNSRIMHRVFKSIDKNVGNNDGKVDSAEYQKAFNSETPAGGLVRVRLGGTGDVSESHVQWRHKKGLPYVTAPLLYEGVLYSVRNGGILSTFDPETGKLLREERLKGAIGDYYASPVAADGKVYFLNKDGKLTVIKAGRDWEVLSSADLAEQAIATPAIADSRVFVRTDAALYCFGTRKG